MKDRMIFLLIGLLLGLSSFVVADRPGKECDAFASRCLSSLVAKARNRAWVGVELQHLESKLGHLEVTRVTSDSPAAKAGLRVGDLIVGIGDASFKSMTRFEAIDALAGKTLASLVPGKAVPIQLERGAAELVVELVPASYSNDRHSLAVFIGRSLMSQYPEVVEVF